MNEQPLPQFLQYQPPSPIKHDDGTLAKPMMKLIKTMVKMKGVPRIKKGLVIKKKKARVM